DRPFRSQLGQIDGLAVGILDLELGRLLADINLLRGLGGFVGECSTGDDKRCQCGQEDTAHEHLLEGRKRWDQLAGERDENTILARALQTNLGNDWPHDFPGYTGESITPAGVAII